MSDRPTLRGERVVLRPPGPGDLEKLRAMFQEPSVARWWGPQEEEEIIEHVERPGFFIVESDGVFSGLIQYDEEDDPQYRHAGIDISLVTAAQGRGLGADAVRTLARHLFDGLGHHRIVIDPAAHNAPAIRCYTKVGFKPVGIMRAYERSPGGEWHDGLLMDMLRADFDAASKIGVEPGPGEA